MVGVLGSLMHCRNKRSLFYYVFLFTAKSKNATPARASVNNLLHMDHSYEDNPMNATNMAKSNYLNNCYIQKNVSRQPRKQQQQRRTSPQKKSTRYNSSLIEDSLAGMSIYGDDDINSDEDEAFTPSVSARRRRRQSSTSRGAETASQHRSRTRGKVQRTHRPRRLLMEQQLED